MLVSYQDVSRERAYVKPKCSARFIYISGAIPKHVARVSFLMHFLCCLLSKFYR